MDKYIFLKNRNFIIRCDKIVSVRIEETQDGNIEGVWIAFHTEDIYNNISEQCKDIDDAKEKLKNIKWFFEDERKILEM